MPKGLRRKCTICAHNQRGRIDYLLVTSGGSHGGGDRVTMLEFLNACAGRSPPPITSPEETMRGLVFALAAERARKDEAVVQLQSSDFDLVS